ncbi:MAG: YceD family protein [Solirubrobacteraceae bacterium]
MGIMVDMLDLASFHLAPGESRRLDVALPIEPVQLGAQSYEVEADPLPAGLEVSRVSGDGYALRLRFDVALRGPCMRCLETAVASFRVDAREVWLPGGDEELALPYVQGTLLDVAAWGRDSLILELPVQIVCRADCAGLCANCGANLNVVGAGHHHDDAPDPRLAKLAQMRFQ